MPEKDPRRHGHRASIGPPVFAVALCHLRHCLLRRARNLAVTAPNHRRGRDARVLYGFHLMAAGVPGFWKAADHDDKRPIALHGSAQTYISQLYVPELRHIATL